MVADALVWRGEVTLHQICQHSSHVMVENILSVPTDEDTPIRKMKYDEVFMNQS